MGTSTPMSISDIVKSSLFSHEEPPEDNCFIRNTFINIAPPSPVKHDIGSRKRAHSVPKDLGSNRSAWEAMHHALLFAPQPSQCSLASKSDSMSSDAGSKIDKEVLFQQHGRQQHEQQ